MSEKINELLLVFSMLFLAPTGEKSVNKSVEEAHIDLTNASLEADTAESSNINSVTGWS